MLMVYDLRAFYNTYRKSLVDCCVASHLNLVRASWNHCSFFFKSGYHKWPSGSQKLNISTQDFRRKLIRMSNVSEGIVTEGVLAPNPEGIWATQPVCILLPQQTLYMQAGASLLKTDGRVCIAFRAASGVADLALVSKRQAIPCGPASSTMVVTCLSFVLVSSWST